MFWNLWARACQAQGWDALSAAERDQRRRDFLSELGFATVKDVDSTDGFDAVKRRLEELADVLHVDSADDAGRRRRVLWRANHALQKLRAAGYPEHSIKTLLAERFRVVSGASRIEDLPAEELLNLSKTSTARLASWQLQSSFLDAALTIARIAILTGIRLPVTPSRRRVSTSCSGPAHAPHTAFSPIAADMQPQFFIGG